MRKVLPLACCFQVALALLASPGWRPSAAAESPPLQITFSATLATEIKSDAVGLFERLSNSKKLETWLPDQAVMEPMLGGRYHFRWKNRGGVWSGVVTEFILGNTLGYTWLPPGQPYETFVRFKLFPQASTTRVELFLSGFDSRRELDGALQEWSAHLLNLKSVVEEGTDMRQADAFRSAALTKKTSTVRSSRKTKKSPR